MPDYLYDVWTEDDYLQGGTSPRKVASSPFGSAEANPDTSLIKPPELKHTAREAFVNAPARPVPKDPRLWQRGLAAALGGLAGYSNAMGRTRYLDPTPAVEGILYPGAGREQAKWASEREQLHQKAALEDAENKAALDSYDAYLKRSRTEAQNAASAADEALKRKQLEQAGVGSWSSAGGSTIFNSKTGESKKLKEEERVWKEGEGVEVGKDEFGRPIVYQPIPKAQPASSSPYAYIPEAERGRLARLEIESKIAKNRNTGAKAKQKSEGELRGQIQQESDSKYKTVDTKYKGRIDAVESEMKARIKALGKEASPEDIAKATAEKERKIKEIKKSWVQEYNSIETNKAKRRRQLGLAEDERPTGRYNENFEWIPNEYRNLPNPGSPETPGAGAAGSDPVRQEVEQYRRLRMGLPSQQGRTM